MEQRIGIVVNPYKCLKDFCIKRQMKMNFQPVVSPFGQSSPVILKYRLSVHNVHGIYKSVTALGRGMTSAKDNAAYTLLRLVGESEFQVDIDSLSERHNAVIALTNYTKAMQNLTTPQFNITLSETDQLCFQCKCTIVGISCQAEAPSKYAAKQQSAFLVLQQIEMNELKKIGPVSVTKKFQLPERRKEWVKLDSFAAITYQQFAATGYAVSRIEFVDMFETQKLAISIYEFLNAVAEELNCTPEQYLSTTNYWRLPCKLTQDVDGLLIHEILHDLEKFFGIKDIKPTTSFLINMKNLTIDEGWANISRTPYDFRVWTPCFVDDYTELTLSDRFEIFSILDDNITKLYSPNIGESLILRHNTKFKLIGPTQMDHFYFVSEWKRDGNNVSNQISSVDCNFLVDPKKYEKIKWTLLLGLEKLRRLYFQYNLIECIDEWLYILDIYADASVMRPHRLIDSFIDVAVARKTLKSLRIFLKAKEHHGRNLTERFFLKAIDNDLLEPIQEYSKRKMVSNNNLQRRFGNPQDMEKITRKC